MERKPYERIELEILEFETDDVITTSNIDYEEDETLRVR